MEELKLKNFEAHKASTLQLEDGVCVVTGDSDTGKSSILRAFYWLAKNKPAGLDSVKCWYSEQPTEASLKVDGTSVRRVRSKTDNCYYVGKKKLEAFGQDVPEEVTDLLNLADSAIEKQLDSHYLLSSTPGEVAKTLNKVVQLDKIDSLNVNLESLRRGTNKEQALVKKDLGQYQEQLTQYDYLDEAEKAVVRLEALEAEQAELTASVADVESILDGIAAVDSETEGLEEWLGIRKPVNELQARLDEYKSQTFTYSELSDLLAGLDCVRGKEEELIAIDVEIVNQLLGKILERNRLRSGVDTLGRLLVDIDKYDYMLEVSEENIARKEVEYKEKVIEAREVGVCPVVSEFGQCLYPEERR